MDEAALNQISITTIILVTISVHHIYFGKDIPKWSWYLSILFSIISGMYVGFVIARFPGNLILGSLFAFTVFITNFVVRKIRNRQETFSLKE